MAIKKTTFVITVMLLALVCSASGRIDHTSAVVSPKIPNYIELGYGPGDLASVQNQVPIFAPGDSMWFLTTSSKVASVELSSTNGIVVSSRSVSPSSVFELYSFTSLDNGGNWSIAVTFDNLSTFAFLVPFVNPSSQPVDVALSGYSLQSGNVKLNFAVSQNNAFDAEICLGSPDVNSSIALTVPTSYGGGDMIIEGGTQATEIYFQSEVTSTFTFWYEMDYSYSYQGNLSGEIISRDFSVFKSNTVVVSNPAPMTMHVANYTSPRPGRYTLNAYFESGSGISVEQTSVLLLDSLDWIWIGACSTSVNSLSFSTAASLQGDALGWPTSLYYMYDINGVDSYTQVPVSLKVGRMDFVGIVAGSNLQNFNFAVAPDENINQSNFFDGSLYFIARGFPLTLQVTPSWGESKLPTEIMAFTQSYTIMQDIINVGEINASVTNNTASLSGAAIAADNGRGGSVTSSSNVGGFAVLTVPAGTYNVTVTSGGQSLTKRVSVSTDQKVPLHFAFTTGSTPTDSLEYVLLSLAVIGLLANGVLWLRPKR